MVLMNLTTADNACVRQYMQEHTPLSHNIIVKKIMNAGVVTHRSQVPIPLSQILMPVSGDT